MKDLAIQVARARADAGLTLGELADKAGLQHNVMTCIENAFFESVTIEELVKVSVALGCNLHVNFRKPKDCCPECGRSDRASTGACECGWSADDGGQAMTTQPRRSDTGAGSAGTSAS